MVTRKSNKGQNIDMEALIAANKESPAVGNMRVNAAGDVVGPGGKVVQPNEDRVRAYYKDNPAKAKPIWPIELYATNLFKFFCPIAATEPKIIEAIDRKTIIICHWSIILIKGTYKNLIKTVNAAILGTTAKNNVTDVGDPS